MQDSQNSPDSAISALPPIAVGYFAFQKQKYSFHTVSFYEPGGDAKLGKYYTCSIEYGLVGRSSNAESSFVCLVEKLVEHFFAKYILRENSPSPDLEFCAQLHAAYKAFHLTARAERKLPAHRKLLQKDMDILVNNSLTKQIYQLNKSRKEKIHLINEYGSGASTISEKMHAEL